MGVTMQLPEADRHTYTKGFLETQVAVLMGGRVAEELFMKHMTSGASNDIERATDIAQHMVCEWGMSELGPLAYRKPGNAFEADRAARDQRSDGTARRRGNPPRDHERLRPRPHTHRRATATPCACWPNELLQVESLEADEIRVILEQAAACALELRRGFAEILNGP